MLINGPVNRFPSCQFAWGFRSVQPFLPNSPMWRDQQTHRHANHATPSVAIGAGSILTGPRVERWKPIDVQRSPVWVGEVERKRVDDGERSLSNLWRADETRMTTAHQRRVDVKPQHHPACVSSFTQYTSCTTSADDPIDPLLRKNQHWC